MNPVLEVQTTLISISKEFSKCPGPRFIWQGKDSGEAFLNDLLKPQFIRAEAANQILIVNLDGTEGYSTAFLDGSFGVLAREFGTDRVLTTLRIISNDEPYLEQEIKSYVKQASAK